MNNVTIRKQAKAFAEYWKDKGYEKGQSQLFWIMFLRDILGVEHPERIITFEDKVKLDHTSFIDGYIASTKVLIEQKSIDKDLSKAIKQSDGSLLTPFQQAKRYISELPLSRHPRWVITCNFKEFYIYDMEKPTGEPEKIKLCDLENEYYRFSFIVKEEDELLKREMDISIQAGDIVGKIYESLLKKYINPDNEESLKSLNILCVRLVFCLYAEDSGLFTKRLQFHNYIKSLGVKNVRKGLIELFKVLDTKYEDRDPYLDDDLKEFPYVNGGLFENENIEIPNFDEEIVELILKQGSEDFDWSQISPTIFGAVFESTLNPETRRKGGMHYTSIENIHKVIDPLFLDDLRNELNLIKEISNKKQKNLKLNEYRNKLASLKFLDPACGSGNFLTETYISLRRLENEALRIELDDTYTMDLFNDYIKVSIKQFYGIEINDFACVVAKTALWISEAQMMRETENIICQNLQFLPLKSYTNIVEYNALRIDWNNVIDKNELNFIMGNPPFVGAMWSKGTQRDDILKVFPECSKPGQIDYVCGWYVKAAKYIKDTNIKCAFVSTNSICQGQQVELLWKPMHEKFNIKIDFAHKTFRWDSEANIKAHVHCVIVGFSNVQTFTIKKLFDSNDKYIQVECINGYLNPSENFYITARTKQISNMPNMHMGVMARDGGNLILNQEEYNEYICKEPQGKKFIKQYMMGNEFLNNIPRYCFWLLGADPGEIKRCPLLLKRIENVRETRLASPAKETQKLANTPTLFAQLAQPTNDFIALPEVSSEKRRYIPIGFMSKDIIVGNKLYVVENVGLYHFGIMTSNVHNAWMRAVAGRLETRYCYSNTIVYNNFVWPTPNNSQKEMIEKTAQLILDARALYPNSSLADLYDELLMPVELRKAHQLNDKAVMEAYGFDIKMTESECVSALMEMYKIMMEN